MTSDESTEGLSPHDEEMLREFYVCFDRPAFNVNFEHESDLNALIAAIGDTIAALSTGVKIRRDSVQFGKPVEGKVYFENDELRREFDEIVDILSGIEILYAHARMAGYFFDGPHGVAFHRDHQKGADRVALLVDESRNRVLEIVNGVYASEGYREFEYIRSPEYYDGYDELQKLKRRAKRRRFLSILDVLKIQPEFCGVGLDVNAIFDQR
jgi:hypothetical protein